jgi:predicted lactoylglutathione lyase
VDQFVGRAIDAGGRQAMEPIDRGFMYGRSFYDPDGHHWEAFWMDPKASQ